MRVCILLHTTVVKHSTEQFR